jgi:histidinol-phosphate/aromatic aminotransferase/cobyric acid decarboxylase-like protein
LRQALAQTHQIAPDWVLPGNGAAELLTWASRELAQLDATYLLVPAFGDYLRALNAFDASVVPMALDLRHRKEHSRSQPEAIDPAFGLQIVTLVQHARLNPQSAASVIPQTCGLLLNNPHNPTGQLASIEAIAPLLEQFALVVIDEAFMDFLPLQQQQSLIDQIAQYPNLVILRSLTKFYSLPGLRLGYAVAHPDRLRRWQRWRDPWSVNVLAEAAGVAVLHDTLFQQQTWDWLMPARTQLFDGLSALPGLYPLSGAANFLLVQSDRSTVQIQQQLLQRHQILIRDCMSFAELGDRFFRVAVRTQAENQRLLDGLADVLQGKGE